MTSKDDPGKEHERSFEKDETIPVPPGTIPSDLSSSSAALSPSREPHPEQVGPYKILEVIGEGGMGVIFLAEQTEPIRRRVAIKLIKLGMDTREVVARFESERQALAIMNHPNIAKVYDAGATEHGRPYFVMEYVPGESITRYCDRNRLSTQERLELFLPVCEAVQHAHHKAIIHRDLKPSNVLVMLQDGKPIPKVIDFGVAKAMDKRLTEKTFFTEQGQILGTPEYMSPEQAEMGPLEIDTRTDIYSLGVLLYELLTGSLPFEPRSLRQAGYAEIVRIIREDEPRRPSQRLTELDPASTTDIAKKRGTQARALVRQVQGDLDWVIMKALEKDRTRRYSSASELSADLIRHLKLEPVQAGPPNAVYRIRKFVKRNRKAAVWILVALLMAATGAALLGLSAKAKAARLAEWRGEEGKVLSLIQELARGGDPEALARGQAAMDRLTARILAGQGTQEEIRSVLLALPQVELEGRRLQAKGDVQLSLAFKLRGPFHLKGLGAILAPRIRMDGVEDAFASSEVLRDFRGSRGVGAWVSRRFLCKPQTGQHSLQGHIEAALVRFQPDHESTSTRAIQGKDYQSTIGLPVVLPFEDFPFVVCDELPPDYPPAIVNEELALAFSRDAKVGPLLMARSEGERCRGKLKVSIPNSPLTIPLLVELQGPVGEGMFLRKTSIMVKSNGVCYEGSNDFNSVTGGGDLYFDLDVPAGGSHPSSCQVTIRSSREVALSHPEVNEYLKVELSKNLSVEVVERKDLEH